MARDRIGKRPKVTAVSKAGCRAFGATLNSVHVNLYLPNSVKRRIALSGDFFCVRFPNDMQDDPQAQYLCDCLIGLLAASDNPAGDQIIRPFKIPLKYISTSTQLSSRAIERQLIKDDEFIKEPTLYIHEVFGSHISFSRDLEDWVWKMLPGCADSKVAKALFFIACSLNRFCFYPGDQHDIVSGVQDAGIPKSAIDQVEIESIAMDAYKAIEAIVGDPGGDLRKFRLKVTESGINPDEMVGYHEKVPLAENIITLNKHRDSRVAHGSYPRSNPLSYFELMDWQECAKHVVTSALIKSKQDVLAKKIL
jgi:hypothetical protein